MGSFRGSLVMMRRAFITGVVVSFLLLPEATGQDDDFLFLIQEPGLEPRESTRDKNYYCTFRNLWTRERMPVGYPYPQGFWDFPLVWGHPEDLLVWNAGSMATETMNIFLEVSVNVHWCLFSSGFVVRLSSFL